MGSQLSTGYHSKRGFNDSKGGCKTTAPYSISLTSNRVTANNEHTVVDIRLAKNVHIKPDMIWQESKILKCQPTQVSFFYITP